MNHEKYTAVIFGASGLTGRFLMEHLIQDQNYESVKIFVRRELPMISGKIRQVLYDPEKINLVESEITGDHLYCCIGSTIKDAGSKENFKRIDHDLVERIAKYASANKMKSFVVISSIGANHNSRNFYLRVKGQMEESIKTFRFENLIIVRPSMLLGIRSRKRGGEEIGKVLATVFSPLLFGPLKKYRPIHASTVAKAMIKSAAGNKGIKTIESNELVKISTGYFE